LFFASEVKTNSSYIHSPMLVAFEFRSRVVVLKLPSFDTFHLVTQQNEVVAWVFTPFYYT